VKPSSAHFISYDLRPAKQAERRMLIDFLKCANESFAVSGCRYVGMGGTRFYDFHLLHRFLGINHMVSLERDKDIFRRASFNCPYDFISVEPRSVSEFLAKDSDTSQTIFWLDYDDGLSPEIVADILSLGTKAQAGGFAFVTVTGEAPGVLRNASPVERLDYFQSNFSDFSLGLTEADMEDTEFRNTVSKILVSAFQNAFAARQDGELKPLFKVIYKDSMWMVTVGGCFCAPATTTSIARRMKKDLPFLLKDKPYTIISLNITEAERLLFDMAVTKRRANSRQANLLKSMGFKQRHLDTYADLLRFLPRYSESII